MRDEFYRGWFREALGSEPYDYQLKILAKPGFLIINKARQTGISTAMACLAVATAGFGGKKVLICSNKEDAAVHILNDYAPSFIRPFEHVLGKPATDEKTLIQWPSGGEIRCFAANPDGARGFPAHLIIFDEFAHFTKERDMDRRMLEAVLPSISQTGGRLVVLSTPRGQNNEFARMWHSPDIPDSKRIIVHYTDCPNLAANVQSQETPYGKRYAILDTPIPEISFLQEYCNRFDVSSDEAIPTQAIWDALQPDDAGAWA